MFRIVVALALICPSATTEARPRLARAWPAPRVAAVRRHHVFVLFEQLVAEIWLAHDSNSGGGLTRLHARSLAGFIIVDPSEAR
ncbi:hypothetical protein [Bradyrhizobium viridifuturi]|uniref:hypothetical protein n=1 Tax=Bradyrhizobium viridifuturi TaxID=1654716 RepID=UPI00067EFCB1|nr:hypothetical protein [Bradyrhizobium viridifuturi]